MKISKYYVGSDCETKKFTVMKDDYPESPRDFDNVGEMYIEWGYRRDHYGDDFKNRTLSQIIREFCHKHTDLTEEQIEDEMTDNELIVYLQTKCTSDLRVFPIFGYEHSGFTVSMGNEYPYNDRWDGGLAGFIFIEKERCEAIGCDFEKAREIAESEVKTFDMYLQGYVYGYDNGDGETCWGFYSDKYGDELFNEIAEEAGYLGVMFFNENEIVGEEEQDSEREEY